MKGVFQEQYSVEYLWTADFVQLLFCFDTPWSTTCYVYQEVKPNFQKVKKSFSSITNQKI